MGLVNVLLLILLVLLVLVFRHEIIHSVREVIVGGSGGAKNKKIKILSLNIEYGAENYGTESLIKLVSKYDIVVFIESLRNDWTNASASVAEEMGWYHETFVNQTTIMSREPFIPDRTHTFGIAKFNVGAGAHSPASPLYILSVHMGDFPYVPNMAAGIEYCAKEDLCTVPEKMSAKDLVNTSYITRGNEAREIVEFGLANPGTIIVTGDFNEPSHLDWTKRATAAKLVPRPLDFSASKIIVDGGFTDMYRLKHPNEVRYPGYTWPTTDPGYPYRPDRIDFIYLKSTGTARVSGLISEPIKTPSDHYGLALELSYSSKVSTK
jgi:endonuclease/exonuclease/phosphatase family metal-dependent hydrolase